MVFRDLEHKWMNENGSNCCHRTMVSAVLNVNSQVAIRFFIAACLQVLASKTEKTGASLMKLISL